MSKQSEANDAISWSEAAGLALQSSHCCDVWLCGSRVGYWYLLLCAVKM